MQNDHDLKLTAAVSLVDLLSVRARCQADDNAFVFLRNDDEEKEPITFGELDQRARQIAVALRAIASSGDRAILLLPSGIDYITAFFGCLYADVIAIPAYPPTNERNMPRIEAIAADAGAKVIIATAAVTNRVLALRTDSPVIDGAQWLIVDDMSEWQAGVWSPPRISGDTVAFLQYTSGSTGSPKGVMVTHANLLHNLGQMHQLFGHSASSRSVTWLPLFHDLGLIFGILLPLYGGFSCVCMSPTSFLQRPYRWLKAISDHRATTSGAPNFAYDLCTKRISNEQKKTLDLSGWTTALNGAEPVRKETLKAFDDAFRPSGFRASTFSPCYGLAEATLVVSGTSVRALPHSVAFHKDAYQQRRIELSEGESKGDVELVSGGSGFSDQEIVITNPDTCRRAAPGEVGEIWLAGPSVAKGYWNRPQETRETFEAELEPRSPARYLRTGDLGFIHENQLFISGRLKDMMIIRGRNFYPQDIEASIETSHPATRMAGAAAFSVDVDQEERLVVVQELDYRQKPDVYEVIAAIRECVAEEHDVVPYAVALINPGGIRKTSSGKVQRRAMRSDFLDGRLPVVAEWREHRRGDADFLSNHPVSRELLRSVPPQERPEFVKTFLRANLARILNIDEASVDATRSLVAQGLDSLGAAELISQVESRLKTTLSLARLFQNATVVSLVDQIVSAIEAEQDLQPQEQAVG